MPQFDPTILVSQIFWILVTFGVFYLIVSNFLLPRLADMIEERQDRIDHDLDKAAELRAEADAVMSDYDEALVEARKKVTEILVQTTDDIKVMNRERHAEISTKISEELTRAEQRIKLSKEKAMEDVKSVAQEVAVAACKKLTGHAVKGNQAGTAVDKAISQNLDKEAA